jgi:hypothetical protein
MFVAPPRARVADAPPAAPPGRHGRPESVRELDPAARASLARLAEQTRPVAAVRSRLLPVAAPLVPLFPDGGLQRGTSVVIGDGAAGAGASSLTLALVAAATRSGSFGAVVGVDAFGAVAADQLGIDLRRLAVVPRPGAAWADVAAALCDGVDLVVLAPSFRPRPATARRLVARARDRGAVLLVAPGRAAWPEPPDVRLTVVETDWEGAGTGHGHLARRRMVVEAGGRRSAALVRHHRLWLPGPDGTPVGMEC